MSSVAWFVLESRGDPSDLCRWRFAFDSFDSFHKEASGAGPWGWWCAITWLHCQIGPATRASLGSVHSIRSIRSIEERGHPGINQPRSRQKIQVRDVDWDKKGQQPANRKSYSVLPCRRQNAPKALLGIHWPRADALSRNEHEAWGRHRAPAARIQALARPALPGPNLVPGFGQPPAN